jgi:protein-disulfide isomerase
MSPISDRGDVKLKKSLFVSTLIVLVISGAASLSSHYHNIFQIASAQIASNSLSISSLTKDGSPYLGKPFAPITVVEFGDFQCDKCARFAKGAEPELNQAYIQTGKAVLLFKHFPIHGPDSKTAAIASQCANDQGKFWDFHDIVLKNQGPENSGWANKDNLKKFASQILGLDIQTFNSCLESQKYASFVENDMTLANSLGLHATPSFVIVKSDGSSPDTLSGAYPYPAFQALIDKKIDGG